MIKVGNISHLHNQTLAAVFSPSPSVIMIRVKDEPKFFFFFFLHISVHRGGAVTTWSTFEPGLRNIFRARGRKKIRPCVGGRRPGDDCMAGGWKEDEEQQQQQDASIFLIDDRVANSIIISSLPFTHWRVGIGNITLFTCGWLTLIPCHKH